MKVNSVRIGFFIPDLGDGGAQRQCAMLANEFARRPGVHFFFVCYRPGVHDNLLAVPAGSVHQMGLRSNFDPRAIWRLRKILKRERADILVSWLHPADAVAYFGCALSRVKWVVAERASNYPPRLRFRLRTFLALRSDAVISNSTVGMRLWREGNGHDRVYLVDNIAPAQRSRPDTADSHAFRVLVIGRLVERKNPLVAAAALSRCSQQFPALEFDFVGDGSLRSQVQETIDEHGAGQHVRVLGFQKDVSPLLDEAVAVVHLSKHEGQPNVLLEAAAASVPIVASEIQEHVDLLGSRYPLFVKDLESPDGCIRVLSQLLSDPEVHGKDAFSYVRERLANMSAERVGDSYERILREVVGRFD